MKNFKITNKFQLWDFNKARLTFFFYLKITTVSMVKRTYCANIGGATVLALKTIKCENVPDRIKNKFWSNFRVG